MTAKRFTIEKYYQIKDNETNRYYESSDVDDGVALHDLLNELNDENKGLRMVIDELKQQNQKLKGRLNDLGVEYYD